MDERLVSCGAEVKLDLLIEHALEPALQLLPANMDSVEARAMCVAIALQESHLEHRRQVGGPARGYWQFELGGGVRGVLSHPASKPYIRQVLAALDYDAAPEDLPGVCYAAIEHNDILAAAFARLLLWTLPDALSGRDEPDLGWQQYLKAWRPGKLHPDTWDDNFAKAWRLV